MRLVSRYTAPTGTLDRERSNSAVTAVLMMRCGVVLFYMLLCCIDSLYQFSHLRVYVDVDAV